MVLLHSVSGEETGVYFADSTRLAVCHNRRIHRHRVFDGLAARGKTSMGWFYGLKRHFVINHTGQIVALKITPGNTADSTVLDEMTRHLAGKLYADKGYIGHELFNALWRRGASGGSGSTRPVSRATRRRRGCGRSPRTCTAPS